MSPRSRSVANTLVGVVGKALVWAGLLLLGLVAYQLWGTGLETQRAQNRLEREFEELLTEATETPPDTEPGITSGVAPPVTAPNRPTKALALIRIPSAGVSDIVVDGVSASALRQGPGHVPDTPLPGRPGNSAIAGHRSSYGAPFGDLDRVEQGDTVEITTVEGQFVYTVTSVEIVKPTRTDVMATTSKKKTLTLITCHPRYSTDKRLVVHAELTSSESSTTLQSTTPPPTTTPSTTTPSTTTPSTTTPDTVPVDTVPAEEKPVDETPVDATPIDAIPVDAIPIDAIPIDEVGGWFSDTNAILPTVLLGLGLVALAFAAHFLRRALRPKFRRSVVAQFVAYAIVAIPFVVTLFFFYRFLNFLLPAPG